MRKIGESWHELLILIILATLFAFASYRISQRIPDVISHYGDVWFGTDTHRIVDDMTNPLSGHWRTHTHPIFPLIAYPPVKALSIMLGVRPLVAVRLIIAFMASLWISLLFILLRILGCRLFDATLFSILGATSAAAMFWFAVPETSSFGSLTIVIALVTVAADQHKKNLGFGMCV